LITNRMTGFIDVPSECTTYVHKGYRGVLYE